MVRGPAPVIPFDEGIPFVPQPPPDLRPPRGAVVVSVSQAASLLAQAHAILEEIVDHGWRNQEADLVAVASELRKARRHASTAYFRTHAAAGLFTPKQERE